MAEPEDKIKLEKATEHHSEEDSTPVTDTKTILIAVGIIIGIFAFSIVGFKLYEKYFSETQVVNVDDLHKENLQGELNEKEGYMYNGYSFVYVDGLWWTEVNRFGTLLKIPLHFGAKEVESIPVTGTLDSAFNNGELVYIAINPETANKYYTLALSELNFNIIKGIDRSIEAACTENNSICDNRTIVSCENTQGNPVVELALTNYTDSANSGKIEFKGSCIRISGQDYELVKAVDKVLLRWYGIMK
ncbi:hypothetical protein HZC30_07150 [Candidatus Woesearchaeota archaeon]|nr:hypothetical protein [Candidatus Woesearchaeota archaeon]